MTKSILSLIIYLYLVLLSGCNKEVSINGEQFANKWKSSEMNSAVSWWYLGENEDHYFVSENIPLEENIYEVPKSAVSIIGIDPFKYKSGKKPVNLKINNVAIY
jgi:hypothetical protein